MSLTSAVFFGSTTGFNSKFDIGKDPKHIEIDFIESKVGDHSGVEALRTISNKYIEAGKKVTLTHLSPDCKAMLLKWNQEFTNIITPMIREINKRIVQNSLFLNIDEISI